MWKRVGMAAVMLCGGMAFLHPTAAVAQDYRTQYRGESRYMRDGGRFDGRVQEHEWRERERREQWHREQRWHEDWREREWREHEWRERDRWQPAPQPYYDYRY